jgi:hypothetical protein
VRGSTVDGRIGWPAGGPVRGGPVRGIGSGAIGGAAGFVAVLPGTPDDVEGKPVRGSVGAWLLGSPVRGSVVDGTPTGGVGVGAGDGETVDGNEPGRDRGVGAVVEPVCAAA